MDVRERVDVGEDGTAVRVLAGAQLRGGSSLRFYNGSRLEMAGDATMAAHLELYDTAKVIGPGTLTLAGNQTVTGTYERLPTGA